MPDVLAAVGLLLLSVGVGLWSIPAALVVAGAVLLVVGLVAAARERAARPGPSERVA
jgi:cytochrome c-type biogenesis protein CcmH/NrfF